VAQLNLATHGLSAKLGDNSSNVIIQNSPDGKTNTTPLVLKFPQLHSGDDVWLTTSEGDDVTLFDSSGNGIPRGLGDGSDGWDLTTMAGTGTSLTVYVAATGGSANVNDIYFTLHDKPSGGTTVPIDSNRGTAVDLVIENSVGTQLSRYSAAPTTYEVGQIANWKAVVLSPFPAALTTSVSWTFPSGDNEIIDGAMARRIRPLPGQIQEARLRSPAQMHQEWGPPSRIFRFSGYRLGAARRRRLFHSRLPLKRLPCVAEYR